MHAPKLSIIVPAFNVGEFINRCVTSIASDQFGKNVEIIVIDDGSTDETKEVLEKLLQQIVGLKVIRQPNSGLGAARNLGLEHARGAYVWFVDGDDFLTEHAVGKVLAAIELHNPDILVVDFSCADENGNPIDWIACPFGADRGRTMTGGEFFRRYYATTYACMYLFRRALLVGHGLRFQPRINMQDAELLPRVLAVTSTVFVTGIKAYVYVKRAGSFINNTDPLVREQYFRSVIEVRRRLADFLKGLDESAIREGVIAKIEGINRILLMAYLYDPLDAPALTWRLAVMRSEGVYPFSTCPGVTLKDRLLRVAVNFQPILFPKLYKWVRERSALQYVAALVRRAGGRDE